MTMRFKSDSICIAVLPCDSVAILIALCVSMRFLLLGLAVSAEGSSGRVIYHANPDVDGKPWYDDVLLVEEFHPDGVTPKELHSGRLRALVHLSVPGDHDPMILCFVHAFRTAKRKQGARSFQFDIAAPEARWTEEVPYSCMRFAYSYGDQPVMWLLDTESISSGVWVQESFDTPGDFIFIKH